MRSSSTSEDPALDALELIPGIEQQQDDIDHLRHHALHLPDADGLDQDALVARRFADLDRLPPVTLLGVEEPELTIHPGAIPVLFDYLKEASERSQVIGTTHSPELLDLLSADEVRVVSRRNGSTVVNRMLESQRKAVREGLLTLGEVLRAEGLQSELPAGATGRPRTVKQEKWR